MVLIGRTNAEATITAELAEMEVADLGTKAKDEKNKFAAESFLRDSHTHVRICLYQPELIIFSSIKVPVLRLENFFLWNLLNLPLINCRYLYRTLELFNKSNLFKKTKLRATVRVSDYYLPQNSRFNGAFLTAKR